MSLAEMASHLNSLDIDIFYFRNGGGDICYQVIREILGQWFLFKIYIIKGGLSYCDIDLDELENIMPHYYRDNQDLSVAILLGE